MAGLGEIFALAATGLAIGGRDPKPEVRNQNNRARTERKNTTDIYTTNNSRKTRDKRENLGRKRFRDSRRFKDTGVIPRDYKGYEDWLKRNKGKRIRSVDFNETAEFGRDRRARLDPDDVSGASSDSEFSDMNSMESFASVGSTGSDEGYHGISMNNPGSVIDRMSSITNNRKFESCVAKPSKKNRDKFAERDTWTHQFEQMTFDNPGEAVSANSVAQRSGRNGRMARIEMERQMELDGGYSNYDAYDDNTYGVIDPNSPEFIHDNMTPFVAKGPSAREEAARNDVNARKLELFSGSIGQIDYRPKVERAPLFSPLVGAENIYGDPVRTDEYKARYFPGRYKTNELPFQQVKVTPGLNIGYNAIGKQGYHDMYRVVPRGVDELRTLNNPKISYGSYTGPGKKGDKGPVLGRVAHYRPPTFRERGTKDMVRQAAYFSAPTVYGEYDPKNLATVNRGVKETMKMGPAYFNNEGNTPGKHIGKWQDSRRQNWKYDHPRNLHGHEEQKGQGHNNESFVPDMTKRNLHEQYDRSGLAITGEKESYRTINWNDVPDATKRNLHDQYDRSGLAITGEKESYRAINWNDIPDVTKRNLHDQYDRSGKAITGNREGYRAVDWNDVPDATKRNLHDQYDRAGKAVSGEREGYHTVDWNDVPDATKRNLHEHFDRAGKAISGEREDYVAVNYDDVPDATLRNVHDRYDRAGKAISGEREDYVAVNWDDVADPTKRNLHPHYDRAGMAINGEREDYVAVNYDDVPDVTLRNIHDKYDRAGKAISGEREDYVAINYDDIPDPTKRNIHPHYDRAGKAIVGNREGYHTVNWDDIPDVNMRNIHDKFDRAGKAISGEREDYVAINYDDIPDPTKRNLHPHYDRAGAAISGNREDYHIINWDDVADPTKRNLHPHYDRAGHVSGNREDYVAVNFDDIPDPTKRNLHDKYDRAGAAVSGNREDYIAVNFDDIPDVTMREIHSKPDRAGHVTGNRESYVAVDFDDIPDVTMREIHSKPDRAGHVTGNRESYVAVDFDDIPDPTMREIHPGHRTFNVTGNKHGYRTISWDDVPDVTMREIHPGGRAGPAHQYENKRQPSRHHFMVMKTNAGKDQINENRAPVKIGMEKGYTVDHTAFMHRTLPNATWRPGPHSSNYSNDSLRSMNTRVPVGRTVINDRINWFTKENLEANPLVNDLVFKSVNFDSV
jgi:hypothetical protein